MRTTTNMDVGLPAIQPRVQQGFADSITTKYGFATNNYLGRQSLVYWEPNEGTVIQPPPVQKVSLQQYVVNLKLQLMAMQKEEHMVLGNQRAMLQMLEKVTERQAAENKRAERREEASAQGAQRRSKQSGSNADSRSRSAMGKEAALQEQAAPKRTKAAAKRTVEEMPQDERPLVGTKEGTAKRSPRKRNTASSQKADDTTAAEKTPTKKSRSKQQTNTETKLTDGLSLETGKKSGRTKKTNEKAVDRAHQEIHVTGDNETGIHSPRASAWIAKKSAAIRTRGSLQPRLTEIHTTQLASKPETGNRTKGSLVRRTVQHSELADHQLHQAIKRHSSLDQIGQGQARVRKAGESRAVMSLMSPVLLQRFADQGIRQVWMQRKGSGAEQVHRMARRRVEEGSTGFRWFLNRENAAAKLGRSMQASSVSAKLHGARSAAESRAIGRRSELESESRLGNPQPIQAKHIHIGGGSLRERLMWKPAFWKQVSRKAHSIENNLNDIDVAPLRLQRMREHERGRRASSPSSFGHSSSPSTDFRFSADVSLQHRETTSNNMGTYARAAGTVQYKQASTASGVSGDARSAQSAAMVGAQSRSNGMQASRGRLIQGSFSTAVGSSKHNTARIDQESAGFPAASRPGAPGIGLPNQVATDRRSPLAYGSFNGTREMAELIDRSRMQTATKGTVLQYRLASSPMSSLEAGTPLGNQRAASSLYRSDVWSEAVGAARRKSALPVNANAGSHPSSGFVNPIGEGSHPLQKVRTMHPPDTRSLMHRHSRVTSFRQSGLAGDQPAQLKNGKSPDRNDLVRSAKEQPIEQRTVAQSRLDAKRGSFNNIRSGRPWFASSILTGDTQAVISLREGFAAAHSRSIAAPLSKGVVLSHPAVSVSGVPRSSALITSAKLNSTTPKAASTTSTSTSAASASASVPTRKALAEAVTANTPVTQASSSATNVHPNSGESSNVMIGQSMKAGKAEQPSVRRQASVTLIQRSMVKLPEERDFSARNQRQVRGNHSSSVSMSVPKRRSSHPVGTEHHIGRSRSMPVARGRGGASAHSHARSQTAMLSSNTSWAPAMSQAVAAALASGEHTVRKPAATAAAGAPQAKFAEPAPKLELARMERDSIYGELAAQAGRAGDLLILPASSHGNGREAAHRFERQAELRQKRNSGSGSFVGSTFGSPRLSPPLHGTARAQTSQLRNAGNRSGTNGQGGLMAVLNSGQGRWVQRQTAPAAGAFNQREQSRMPLLHSASQGAHNFATGRGVPSTVQAQSSPVTNTSGRTASAGPIAYAPLSLQNRAPKAEPVAAQPAAGSARSVSPAVSQLEHHKSKRSNPDELAAQAATKAIRQVEEKLKTVEVEITKTVQAAQASLPNMGRFVDKVYKELEKKIKFERQRRGL